MQSLAVTPIYSLHLSGFSPSFYHTFPHLSTPSVHSTKNSSKIVQILFTNPQKYAILYAVKITERQMRWVKLSRIEYPHRPRALMPSAITVAGLFFAYTPIVPEAGRR